MNADGVCATLTTWTDRRPSGGSMDFHTNVGSWRFIADGMRQFAAIFASVARAIWISGSSAIPRAAPPVSVRLTNASR